MKRSLLRLTVVALALVLFATSVHALHFTVTLKNGSTFETRYRPMQADFDENVSMFLTDQANWVAIHNDEIADVTSVFEESGFGYQLDTSTRFIGFSPNDLVTDKTDEDGNIIDETRYDLEADQSTTGFSIDEFLGVPTGGNFGNPATAGGGIPIGAGLLTEQQ